MKSKLSCLAILLLSFSGFAKDMRLEARKEFDACMKETKKYRGQCNSGGCGNVIGACYERQINKISAATDSLAKKASPERCVLAKNSAFNEIEILNSKLKFLTAFDGTWSGYDVQVEAALLKNFVANALTKECAK